MWVIRHFLQQGGGVKIKEGAIFQVLNRHIIKTPIRTNSHTTKTPTQTFNIDKVVLTQIGEAIAIIVRDPILILLDMVIIQQLIKFKDKEHNMAWVKMQISKICPRVQAKIKGHQEGLKTVYIVVHFAGDADSMAIFSGNVQ